MTQLEYIRDLYENEGLSLREIARQTNKDFRTVKKYAYQNNWSPATQKTTAESFPVMGAYISIVNDWLEQDEREPRKQRHTVKRMYDRLREEYGYKGSYGSVKRYVANKKLEQKKYSESFLPLAHPPGYAQVDFGKFKYYDSLISLNEKMDEMMVFRNWFNEQHSKDTSKKVRSVKKMCAQSGKYMGTYAPYGFMKDPNNKHRFLIEDAVIIEPTLRNQ